jgi:hypothetical protein
MEKQDDIGANKSKYQSNKTKQISQPPISIGANKSNKGTDELTNRNKIDAPRSHSIATKHKYHFSKSTGAVQPKSV